jgi:hypothetical protein
MGQDRKTSSEDSAQTPDPQRSGQRENRTRPALPDPDAKADTSGTTGEAVQTTKVANPLGPAADLAVVDRDGQAIIFEQPKRGSGSKMPNDTYRAIIMLLREGVPVVHLSDRYGVATTTIHEMKKRHDDVIPAHRDVMARKSENLREVLSDKMIETVQSGRMSPNQYAFTYGVISQHYQTETGINQTKHEHIHINLDKNDLGSLLSGLNGTTTDKESVGAVDLPPQKQGDA